MPKINLKDTLRIGKKFCVYPFVHYYTDVKKDRRLCCYSRDIITEDSLQQIRTDMLNDVGATPCIGCYQQEENKLISYRQLAIKDFLPLEDKVNQCIDDFNNNKEVQPISYDLRYSNLCNLECQICYPAVSSAIARAKGKTVTFFSYEPDLSVNSDAERVYLAGGEPFLIKSYVKVLNSITNTDCIVVVNTNGTVLTESMLSALDRFPNITFTVSIDGYGELNDRLRKNSDWNTIVNNVKTLIDRYGTCIQVNTVIQKDNINHLLPLGKWIESMGINFWTFSELDNKGQYYYKNCQNIVIPDELFDLPIISTNIESVKILKQICQELTTNQT